MQPNMIRLPRDLASREFLQARLDGASEEDAQVRAKNIIKESKIEKKEIYPEPPPADPFDGVTFHPRIDLTDEERREKLMPKDRSNPFQLRYPLNPAHGITASKIHELANPKKLIQSSKLKSSSPPLTPEQIQPEIEKQKEAIEYYDKFKDLPMNWPYCSISKCSEPASWAVQKDMNDSKSPMGFMCSKCFTKLPFAPLTPYRVFKLTVKNYMRLVQLSIDLGGASELVEKKGGDSEIRPPEPIN